MSTYAKADAAFQTANIQIQSRIVTGTKVKSRYTMQDIADRLGITKMTVSRYLKDPSSVAKSTGDKIAKVIEDLGYVRNRAPSMLSKASSNSIGILIPSFSNMVFSDVINGVSAEADRQNYSILITHNNYSLKEEEKQIADLLSYRVDGLILTEPKHSALTVRRLKDFDLPVVEIMSVPYRPIDMAVGLDHEKIAYRSIKALIGCGRKRIAYIAVRLDLRTMQRQAGYERAMREAGLEPLVLSSPERSTFTMAGVLFNQSYETHRDIDGIFCTNDDAAVGAMMACLRRGIKIPDDIAILGYNGLDISRATSPVLCSVLTPRFEMGRLAVEMLIKKIKGEKISKKKIRLSYDFTDGETVTKEELAALKASVY